MQFTDRLRNVAAVLQLFRMVPALVKIHSYSGRVLALFVGMHLFNHVISIGGADTHIQVMQLLRKVYRHPAAEVVVMVAVGVQVYSGIRLFTQRKKEATTFVQRMRVWTGLYLSVFLGIHLSAVWVGRLVLQLDTNFYFGVAGLNTFPANIFFIPYYTLAVLCFFGHLACIHALKMKTTLWRVSPSQQALVLFILGMVLTVTLLYGLTNHFEGVTIPEEYQVVTGKSIID